MKDYVTLGPTPAAEDCERADGDQSRCRKECQIYIRQLERMFPEHEGAYFACKSFPHDFGSYREVCCIFDDDDESAVEYAYKCENNTPQHWDAEALDELAALTVNV